MPHLRRMAEVRRGVLERNIIMKVICFGDSNTYGYENLSYIGGRYDADSRWVDLLAEKTGWNIINEGLNGREIPRRPVLIPEDTDLLIIMLGTNDLLQGNDAARTADRMDKFINSLNIERHKILLIAPPPMKSGFWVPTEDLIRESLKLTACYEILAERKGIWYASAGDWNVDLVFDGIHFSKEGHIAFAKGLYVFLQNFSIGVS